MDTAELIESGPISNVGIRRHLGPPPEGGRPRREGLVGGVGGTGRRLAEVWSHLVGGVSPKTDVESGLISKAEVRRRLGPPEGGTTTARGNWSEDAVDLPTVR